MNAISRIGDVRPDHRLRFPALPVADSAGTSFKHEHLNAILAGSSGFRPAQLTGPSARSRGAD
jgi:hypothetical protein